MVTSNIKKFVIVRGLPGAGKSTLINRISVKAKILDPDLIINNDKSYEKYCKNIIKKDSRFKDLNERTKIYRYLLQKSILLIKKGKNVIWIQPWSKLSGIDYTLKIIRKEFCDIDTIIIEIRVNQKEAYRRYLKKRKNITFNYYYDRYIKYYATVPSSICNKKYIIYNNDSMDFAAKQLEKIFNLLKL